jgi:hypothetical protein
MPKGTILRSLWRYWQTDGRVLSRRRWQRRAFKNQNGSSTYPQHTNGRGPRIARGK